MLMAHKIALNPNNIGYPDFGVFRVSDTRGVILV